MPSISLSGRRGISSGTNRCSNSDSLPARTSIPRLLGVGLSEVAMHPRTFKCHGVVAAQDRTVGHQDAEVEAPLPFCCCRIVMTTAIIIPPLSLC